MIPVLRIEENRWDGKKMCIRDSPSDRVPILKEVGSFIEAPAFYGNLSGEENLEIIRKILGPVSYTHLDVYKRQQQYDRSLDWHFHCQRR